MESELLKKQEDLRFRLKEMGTVAVAFSGGNNEIEFLSFPRMEGRQRILQTGTYTADDCRTGPIPD